MIDYKRCSEVNIDLVYDAFKTGFSDYIIKMDIPKEFFIDRFFGVEGNSLEHSFVAIDDDKPVGIALAGIKNYEGIKTIRCDGLAVAPEYRGRGVSQKLMELHKEEAIKQGCKQMFLEVIVGNDRAISFYKRLGYEKVYDLFYYTLKDVNKLNRNCDLNIDIKPAGMEELKAVREKTRDVHINWQNDMDYIEGSKGQLTLAAYIDDKLIGAVSVNKNTRISFIWVDNQYRNGGVGTNLLISAVKELGLSKLSIGLPNNASIQGFLNRSGFEKDKLSQFEMYYTL
jgi:ribosomal protein S18 acetylase RimI-like enzyme